MNNRYMSGTACWHVSTGWNLFVVKHPFINTIYILCNFENDILTGFDLSQF